MSKNKNLLFGGVAVIAVLCVVVALTVNWKGEKDEGLIKIGVVLPLTGTLSRMGEMERDAMILAAEELVAGGFSQVKLFFEDNQSKSPMAVTAVNKLIDIDKVDLVITSTTGASLAVQPILEEREVLQFAFCMDTDIASQSPNTIRYYMGLEQEISTILKYISDNNIKRVGVLCCKIPAYETLVNKYIDPYFARTQDKLLVYREFYELNQLDFRSQILKLKDAGIDCLILLGYGFEYHNIYKIIDEQKMLNTFEVIGGWGFLYTEISPGFLENTLVAGPEYTFENNKNTLEFKSKFYAKFGYSPNFDAAFAYESIIHLPDIWNKNRNKNGKVNYKEFFSKFRVADGICGSYHFDQDGNMVLEKTGLGIFKNGELTNLYQQ